MAKYELIVKNETIATFRLDLDDDDDRMKDEVLWMRFKEQFPCTTEALQGIEGVRLFSSMGDRKPMGDFEMSRLVLEWESQNISEASRIVTIRADGKSSYKVTITDLVRELGLDIGDQVKVTVKKL